MMSFDAKRIYVVPDQTAQVARAIFPDGNPVMRFCDDLHSVVTDRDFVDLFPVRGRPAEAPVRLALATLLQFMEGLTDRQAADAVRTRIDWTYLLCLELTDVGFDHTVLSEFRTRLLAHGRRSWLFAGSDRGVERAATMYSLIVTAKMNDVDPRAWLADVLRRIGEHPNNRLPDLLPWNWQKPENAPAATAA